MYRQDSFKRQQGFTLIELMIAVVVLSVIMAVAVPTYRQYTVRANRVDAHESLLRIAAANEKFYVQNGIYAGNSQLGQNPPAGLGFTGATSEHGYYDLAIVNSAGNLAIGYTARATPAAGEKQATDTKCTELTLDENGRRGANGGYDPAVVEECWR